jgi:murein DD-endopeptidase MepM/ murein hydrolase activator NlpD
MKKGLPITQSSRSGKQLRSWFGLMLSLACLVMLSVGWVDVAAASSRQSISDQMAQVGSVDELQQHREKIEQQRSQVSKERDRLQSLEKAAQGQLSGLQKNIQATAEQIKANETKLAKATQQLKTLQTKLTVAERAYQKKQSATVARLRFMQRQQGSRGWAVLLQSQNLNEFLDRRQQLKRVYQADREILISLKTESDQIERQRRQIEQQKNQVALITQQLLTQKAEYEDQAVAQLNLIDRLKTDRRALEEAESQLAEDSKSISVLIQRRLAQQRLRGNVAYRGTGQMVFPSNGEITSSFGWRMHPILGYERFHAGIDFGADYGSNIFAADDGVVIFAGWYGGYGNAVIIDHGGGITTLYGHASELFVQEGQSVQQGSTIASVGSTGLSTGPHLHFEVRQNGEPVDPMNYL